jgi:hypothetical protein
MIWITQAIAEQKAIRAIPAANIPPPEVEVTTAKMMEMATIEPYILVVVLIPVV